MSEEGNTTKPPNRKRDRSPEGEALSKKEQLERDRKARMARLRAENEEEEIRLARLDREKQNHLEVQRMAKQAKEQIVRIDQDELQHLDEEEQMKRLLGFSGFASTKGEEVEDNKQSAAKGAAAKNKARKYRQYMNRKGGFNKPLDEMK